MCKPTQEIARTPASALAFSLTPTRARAPQTHTHMRTHAHLHTLTYKHTHTPTHTQECICVYEYKWTRRCNCTQVYTQTSSYDTHTLHTLTGFHTAIQKIQPATHSVRYCNMLQHSTLKVVNTFKDMSRLLPQLTPLASSYSCISPQTALLRDYCDRTAHP